MGQPYIIHFAYDPNGNLLTVTDAKGGTITYTYDVMDRVKTMTDPLGRTETYEYDLNGNLIKFTDRKGQVAESVYDYLNRPVERKYADKTISYTYDAAGRITEIKDSEGNLISRSYDELDRRVRETTALGSISYTYDAIRKTSMTVAGQETVYYSYDANSRMTDLQAEGLNFGFTYDELGRRTALTYPNGVTTSYAYDNASNLLELAHLSAEQIIEKLTYSYDPNGNRLSMDRLNVPVKLPEPVTNTSYNQANQMLTFNDETLEYDENGNLIRKGYTYYTWNARNQLVGISGPDMQASFKYDALGRRIEKTINGKTAQYLYDGLDIVQEIENGMVSTNYIRTLNIDEPLARIKSDGTVRFYQQDALGSVVALTDESGTIKTQYVYDPFGNVSISGEQSDNPFQYTGRENDGTGLYGYRARYYSPELQRFISEDPIGLAGGINLFLYVGANPLSFIDPCGLVSCVVGCHPSITYPSPTPPEPPSPTAQPVITNPTPPTPSPKRTKEECFAAAHWEWEMCMRGDSRSYDKCQKPNDNCFTQMQERLDECLRNEK